MLRSVICVLLASLPVLGQTSDSILVGSVRLKLGMTLRETLTALTPYEVHAQNSDTFESFVSFR